MLAAMSRASIIRIETLEEAERVEKLAQERVEEICRSEKEIEEKELLVSE